MAESIWHCIDKCSWRADSKLGQMLYVFRVKSVYAIISFGPRSLSLSIYIHTGIFIWLCVAGAALANALGGPISKCAGFFVFCL